MPSSDNKPNILSFIEELRRASFASLKSPKKPISQKKQLFYVLHFGRGQHAFVRIRRGTNIDAAEAWDAVDRALLKPPAFVQEEDLSILSRLWATHHFDNESGYEHFVLEPKHGAKTLEKMAATGRLYTHDGTAMLWGKPRSGTLFWRVNADGELLPDLHLEASDGVVSQTLPPCYVDLDNEQIGHILLPAHHETVIQSLMRLPPLSQKEAELLSGALSDIAPDLPRPSQNAQAQLRVITQKPTPMLRLMTAPIYAYRQWRSYQWRGNAALDMAQIFFRYEDAEIFPDDTHVFFELPEGETVRVERCLKEERYFLETLFKTGLEKIPSFILYGKEVPPSAYALKNDEAWEVFMKETLPSLKEAGWEVTYCADFRHHFFTVEAWEADLSDTQDGWFDLDMGILVEGERLSLAPLLASLFKSDARFLESALLSKIPEEETLFLVDAKNRRIRVPAARIKPLAAILIDLFDGFLGSDTLRFSKFDAPRLKELSDVSRFQFRGETDIFALAKRLSRGEGIRNITPPASLALSLRPYQAEGLSWLQFLREHQLSGILADDMGLGKTAQTLAHLLLEKEAGRLQKPALIVLPTSLIFNWKSEAARFAPSLTVLSLHGTDRKERYDTISKSDVVLTTYPLLWRDADFLSSHDYHLLILDEAQTVKNAKSQAAETVRKIRATHRLCLTGTPLENHLGELWSQFDFLLPGFLGTQKQFTKTFRSPIEKEGDVVRRDLLVSRIRPFILRRKKEDVAKELPEKTIIVRKMELSGTQRDLYETVRAAMDALVREEIANKGFARSQIVILDALLKLRQVCCDPRLVKAKSATKVKERAKLDFLMTMLPELVDEGRRILIFSQFTQMLGLIEAELEKARLPYVILTGETTDREAPVRRFQNQEVPLFLISLKAGGVGLNLTAADTVIHYDPWWNPAVENQATDRAHRLGQDKHVFVYKLIVAGSIEEKILALQEKKAKLVEGILSADRSVDVKFGQNDLSALFEPLPTS